MMRTEGGVLSGLTSGILNGGIMNTASEFLPQGLPTVSSLAELAANPNRLYSMLPAARGGLLTNELLDGGLVDRALSMLSSDGALLRDGALMNGELGLLQGGLLDRVPENVARLRQLFAESFSRVTSIPQDAASEFLDLVSTVNLSIPSGAVIQPQLREYLTQRRVLELFTELSEETYGPFRNTLRTFRESIPVEGGLFMSRTDEAPLSSLRSDFENLLSADSTLGTMRPLANSYIADLLPVIAQLADTESVIEGLSLDLGSTFGVGLFPRETVARLLDLKLGLWGSMIDTGVEITVSLAELSREILEVAVAKIPIMAELALALPGVAVDVLFTMLTLTTGIAEGLIDLHLACLEFMMKFPLEVINAMIEVPVTFFDALAFDQAGIIRSFIDQLRSLTGIYTDYTSALGLPMNIFPLDTFSRMSQDLIRVGGINGFAP